MIKTRDLIPNIYYDNSRDFQVLGRIYDVVYNYVKTNIDLMTNLPLNKSSDLSMINLVLTSLGFSRKHEYNAEDLKKICLVFVELLKLKGTKRAVELAIATLMNAQNLDIDFEVIDSYKTIGDARVKQYQFDIYIPQELKDIELLDDILDYILPSGYLYRYYLSNYSKQNILKIGVNESIDTYQYSNTNLTNVSKPNTTRDKRPEVVGEEQDLGLTYTGIIYNQVQNSQESENAEENSNE